MITCPVESMALVHIRSNTLIEANNEILDDTVNVEADALVDTITDTLTEAEA